MSFIDNKRAGVLAVIGTTIGAAALVFGPGAAHAGYPCNDQGVPSDVAITTNGGTFVGLDTPSTAPNDPRLVFACVAPTGGESNQKWVAVMASDPSGGAPGAVMEAGGCTGVVPGDPFALGCTYLLKPTGAEAAAPATSTTTSGATPGGSTATGSGTCVYVNGTTPRPELCPGSANVAGVNVATGDASVTTKTTPGGCITAFGNPCYTTAPAGAGVVVAKGDTSNDTVSTTVAGTPVKRDLGDCYGYNMGTCP